MKFIIEYDDFESDDMIDMVNYNKVINAIQIFDTDLKSVINSTDEEISETVINITERIRNKLIKSFEDNGLNVNRIF